MPKMDGFELYTKLREQDPKVKICFLTAIATFSEEYRKMQFTVNKVIHKEHFIQKPIRMEDLIKKLSLMNKDEE